MNLEALITFALLILWVEAVEDRASVENKAVKRSETPIKCGRNEEYTTCVQCPQTCRDLVPTSCTELPCKKGCICKEGFFRSNDDKCVPFAICLIDNIRESLLEFSRDAP